MGSMYSLSFLLVLLSHYVESERSNYSFWSRRGTKITDVKWTPEGRSPLGLVYISHGYGNHMDYLEKLGEALSEAGFVAFGHDHEGHGLSGGERVNTADFQHYVDDVFQDSEIQRKHLQKLPVFIFGHSMGGAITLLSVLQKPYYFKGMVLTGPLIKNDGGYGPGNLFNRILAKVANTFSPSFQAGKPIIAEKSSRIPGVIQQLRGDNLRWSEKFKARHTDAAFKAMDKINRNLHQVRTPFLVLHGSRDSVTWPQGSRDLVSRARTRDKQLIILPGRLHHILLDIGGDEEISRIVQWITDRV